MTHWGTVAQWDLPAHSWNASDRFSRKDFAAVISGDGNTREILYPPVAVIIIAILNVSGGENDAEIIQK